MTAVEASGNEGVHDAGQQEAQKQVGRHAVKKIENFVHSGRRFFNRGKGTDACPQPSCKGWGSEGVDSYSSYGCLVNAFYVLYQG